MFRRILVLFILVSTGAYAQEPFVPAPLLFSSPRLESELETAYRFQLSTITDLRGKEAKFVRESYMSRRDLLLNLLSEGGFIFESPVYEYVKEVFNNILRANPAIDPKTVMLLSRSGIPNAFTTGDGFFVINLGLLVRFTSEDQLAFVISHELAHQIRNHTNEHIRRSASELTDPERKKEINRILRSEYKVLSQLESLVIPGMMNRMRHSRNVEFEADSLGTQLMLNAGYNRIGAIEALEILDKSDEELYLNHIPWQEFISTLTCETPAYWNEVSTESSLGQFEKQVDKYEEELKTHPDCELRVAALMSQSQDSLTKISEEHLQKFVPIQQLSSLEMIESYIALGNLGRALYHVMQIHLAHPEWTYPRETISYLFASIGLHKKYRTLGAHLDLSSPDYVEDYNKFLEVIWSMSIKDCVCIASRKIVDFNLSNTESGQTAKMLTDYIAIPNMDAQLILDKYAAQFPHGIREDQFTSLIKVPIKK